MKNNNYSCAVGMRYDNKYPSDECIGIVALSILKVYLILSATIQIHSMGVIISD